MGKPLNHFREIDGDKISTSLKRILESRIFSRSERLRSFLKFVVEMEQQGRAQEIKGYTIGIDVFSRDQSFDAGSDPLVRVQAGKLRRLLNLYYADEGRREALRIRIPLGGYVPVYEWNVASYIERHTHEGMSLPHRQARSERASREPGTPVNTARNEGHGRDRCNPADDGARSRSELYRLPRIHIDCSRIADGRGLPFVNAVRLAAGLLHGIELTARPIEDNDLAAAHDLDFTLLISASNSTRPLCARLLHAGSRLQLFSQICDAGAATNRLQIAAFANQVVAHTMPIAGLIYQFAKCHGYSTALMDCLEATYKYNLDSSSDAYWEASYHQRRLAHSRHLPGFTTNLADLVALKGAATQDN